MELSFLGAAGTVTGSRHLLESGGKRVLVDCGLFQGLKFLRQRNWAPFPVNPAAIDAVVLTHAHLDHSGYLPRLVRDGFKGPIYASPATLELAEVLLLDSAHIQESDAEFANRHKLSSHEPALPLYTRKDAQRAIDLFQPLERGSFHPIAGNIKIKLHRAGHILGASIVEVKWDGRTLVFSGDLGRYNDPVMPDPDLIEQADYLVLESTYGDRSHDTSPPESVLEALIVRTAERGGTVVIPAFAVGRVQLLLYYLHRLRSQNRLPQNMPIYLDSPMSVRAQEIHCDYPGEQKLTKAQVRDVNAVATRIESVEESKALDTSVMPKIIISASGMATGGRVIHHLKRYAPDPRSSVLFAGYQAAGTRGAKMLAGAQTIKIHGEYIPVKAELDNLSMLSAHADANEILRWLGGFRQAPSHTFLVHGEPEAADALRCRIKDELGWRVRAVEHLEKVDLTHHERR
ncbi:MBL fold metallo-hydrolase RNA specificity domain-containing protein [Neopusillimonas maritima]|uniref:MBL fold metallo-hydrolase n=1 Tax=Neopusillimonas maritima TaxID=2026239 RepID=A0ABX9MYK8_9BURK|nr:MBL fold metallo-hydrolase [Neopusillimonas maritima]RII84075.1 MBL fold metallo-hydrolase [Neopusillimonas maritima]